MAVKEYSMEFKLMAISKVIFDDYSISAAAAECKISNFKMYTWLKSHGELAKEKHKNADLRVKAEQAISDNKTPALNNKEYSTENNVESANGEQTFIN